MEGLIPADYATFTQACFAKMTNYATGVVKLMHGA